MSAPKFEVRILSEPDEVTPLVDQARRAADAHKKALGFLPEAVFREAANQGKLLVAVVRQDDNLVYAGHLLHGGAFPHVKIFQVLTVPRFRLGGIGRRLVEEIVRKAEDEQFMSVHARVADDLPANTFWERLGFKVVRTSPGGRTTCRQINVRIRELNTPTLFRRVVASPITSAPDLNLESRLSDVSPIYVLDLNVLLDLLKKRTNAADAGRIARASLNNLLRLAVTAEFIKELERNSKPSATDPALQLALTLPQLRPPSPETVRALTAELGAFIFPAEAAGGRLRVQDQSDLVHLATAIHCRASGFVTGEKAILRARGVLRARYSLDVVGPHELADTVEPVNVCEGQQIRALSGAQEVQARPTQDDDLASVEQFLGRMRCPSQLSRETLGTDPTHPRRRVVVLSEGTIVGFGSWGLPSEIRPSVRAFICVDEDHSAVRLAADFLLDSTARGSSSDFPVQVSLRLLPGHIVTRRIAAAHGFRPSASETTSSTHLEKIALGRVLTDKNWGRVREQLRRGTGVELPASMPPYGSLAQTVPVQTATSRALRVSLGELETLLSPAIFLLPGRPGAIVPIRRVYADDLIGGAKQLRLLSSPEAIMLHERAYFSSPRTARVLTRGTPILFYESGRSGGSASVIAVSRVARTELVSKKGADRELLRRGVLDRSGLENICLADTVVASTIDSIMLFRNPVELKRLREVGAVGGANLVSARELRSEQISQIAEEGMP